MEISFAGFFNRGRYASIAPKWKKHVSLFTDRALYCPGQTLHVSGVAYEQFDDSVRVISGDCNEVVLQDANRKEVGKLSLETDEFGAFHGDFMLPETLHPGEYELTVQAGERRYIRVDEYKRPTFDVLFHPYKSAYDVGDTLLISGEAKTFAGVPVGGCRLRYKVTRAACKYWRNPANVITLDAGEVQTDIMVTSVSRSSCACRTTTSLL